MAEADELKDRYLGLCLCDNDSIRNPVKEDAAMNEKTFLPGTIGQRLSDLCTAAGITVKELSENTGLEYSTLSRIKNDKN